jgi:hypothetical protein
MLLQGNNVDEKVLEVIYVSLQLNAVCSTITWEAQNGLPPDETTSYFYTYFDR